MKLQVTTSIETVTDKIPRHLEEMYKQYYNPGTNASDHTIRKRIMLRTPLVRRFLRIYSLTAPSDSSHRFSARAVQQQTFLSNVSITDLAC